MDKGFTRSVFLTLLLLMAGLTLVQAQDGDWAIFVSQRSGATELFLMDLDTRQVSQLTDTGRAHLSPYAATDARMLTFASREGSSYEIFTAQISSAWRTRRPLLAAINRLTINAIDEYSPSVSANGQMLAFASQNGIEMMLSSGADRHVLVPTDKQFRSFAPSISPDGKRVAYICNRSGDNELWIADCRTGAIKQLTQGGEVLGGLRWSADSRQIVFTTSATPSKLSGIALASADSGAFRVLTESNDGEASLSPRGSRLIFTSLRDGDPELYLMDLRNGAIERLTRNQGMDGGAVFITPHSGVSRRTPSERRVTLER
jgi:TolB protein